MACASASVSVSPTMPRMSYSRSMVGWKSWVIGISSMGREGFSGGGEQVAIGMQPLARRKVQSPHSFAQLLPRHDMPHPHAAEMRLVEQGEAGREQLAIDDAFAEPRDDAKADAPGQLGRSEEHTSELQSLMRISYAVFCVKKKRK